MDFINRHKKDISGVLSCHDRLSFRGGLPQLQYPKGLQSWLNFKGIRLTEFTRHAERLRDMVIRHAERHAATAGRPYQYVNSPRQSKEQIARDIAERDGIEKGLICVLACVEPNRAFDIRKNWQTKRLELVARVRSCKHLYFYFRDREFGLMYVRLQTWYPFNMQIGLNGHGHLAQALKKKGIQFEKHDNCFTRIDDFIKAQQLADGLARKKWPNTLRVFAERFNPLLLQKEVPGQYYWTLWQSEYATDVLFKDAERLAALYPRLCRHAIVNYDVDRVLRFFGRRLHGNCGGEIVSRQTRRREGVCVKHFMKKNSIKMYDKAGNVLRIETTINEPGDFSVLRRTSEKKGRQKVKKSRPKTKGRQKIKDRQQTKRKNKNIGRARGRRANTARGGKADQTGARKKQVKQNKASSQLRWMPMRKGVVDFKRRAEVSLAANERYLDALAEACRERPTFELTDRVQKRKKRGPNKCRGLRPFDPDEAAFFKAIYRGEHVTNGFSNRDVQARLFDSRPGDKKEARRRSNLVGRRLILFRKHGLIAKIPNRRRYRILPKGRKIMAAALAYRNETTVFPRQAA